MAQARNWEPGDTSDPDAPEFLRLNHSEFASAMAAACGNPDYFEYWLFESEQRTTPLRTILLVSAQVRAEMEASKARSHEDPQDGVSETFLSLAWALHKACERAIRNGTDWQARILAAVGHVMTGKAA